MDITQKDLDNWFCYHSPTPEQVIAYQEIREAGKNLAEVVLKNTPQCADQNAAIRAIRECVMKANLTLACNSNN